MKNKWLVLMATLVLAISCGGGGTPEEEENGEENGGGVAPTVSSLKDAADTAIETTGSTTANPTSFTLTFDQEMDETLVTTAGNITLTCGDLTPTITVAKAADTKTYTITITDAWKYALLTCTLTIPTTVKSSAATALAEEKTYEFTNPCAVSDDFNAGSQSCWTPSISVMGNDTIWSTWPDILANAISFDPGNSALVYDDTRNDTAESRGIGFKKSVTISEDGFQISLYFSSISGITVGGNDNDAVVAIIFDELSTKIYMLGVMGGDGNPLVVAMSIEGGTQGVGFNPTCLATGEFYARLTYAGDSVTADCSTDGTNWSELTPQGGGLALIEGFSGAGNLQLVFNGSGSDDPHNNKASMDSIYTTGLSVSEQY